MTEYRHKLSIHRKHLRSRYWKNLRYKVQLRCKFRCESCNKMDSEVFGEESFHLHHKTYKRFGKERMSDVSYLCPECHSLEHKKKGAPKISDIILQEHNTPKQPKPKARRKKKKRSRKYGYTPKEQKFLSKFKT